MSKSKIGTWTRLGTHFRHGGSEREREGGREEREREASQALLRSGHPEVSASYPGVEPVVFCCATRHGVLSYTWQLRLGLGEDERSWS